MVEREGRGGGWQRCVVLLCTVCKRRRKGELWKGRRRRSDYAFTVKFTVDKPSGDGAN